MASQWRSLVFFLIISSFWSISNVTVALSALEEQEKDRIAALPGQPMVSFKQFSGYVTVNESHGRALFYWLTEATTQPQNKPLLLWLNGGPGCSSIGYGASEEIGPFRINKTGTSLYLNKYSWNKEANLLFLESPAGVGFSYSNTSSDLEDPGDERTAHDALIFLIRWFSRFPQYKFRDFYLSGESYAGHYVPQLAKKIHDYNKAYSHPVINFKGFMVGNAEIDRHYDHVGTIEYWWSRFMISDKSYNKILKLCDFSKTPFSDECNEAIYLAAVDEFGLIDQYSIYTPTCLIPSNNLASNMMSTRPRNTLLRRTPAGYDPCTENYAETYYNLPDVQKSLHANVTGIPYQWTACRGSILGNWKDSQISVLPIYKELIAVGLRIWVFSGDVDSVIPVTATKLSLKQLNLTVKTPYYPWYSGSQVGGWTEVYDGLTFVIVRGAGHEVPLLQPRSGLVLVESFLAGKELPK